MLQLNKNIFVVCIGVPFNSRPSVQRNSLIRMAVHLIFHSKYIIKLYIVRISTGCLISLVCKSLTIIN